MPDTPVQISEKQALTDTFEDYTCITPFERLQQQFEEFFISEEPGKRAGFMYSKIMYDFFAIDFSVIKNMIRLKDEAVYEIEELDHLPEYLQTWWVSGEKLIQEGGETDGKDANAIQNEHLAYLFADWIGTFMDDVEFIVVQPHDEQQKEQQNSLMSILVSAMLEEKLAKLTGVMMPMVSKRQNLYIGYMYDPKYKIHYSLRSFYYNYVPEMMEFSESISKVFESLLQGKAERMITNAKFYYDYMHVPNSSKGRLIEVEWRLQKSGNILPEIDIRLPYEDVLESMQLLVYFPNITMKDRPGRSNLVPINSKHWYLKIEMDEGVQPLLSKVLRDQMLPLLKENTTNDLLLDYVNEFATLLTRFHASVMKSLDNFIQDCITILFQEEMFDIDGSTDEKLAFLLPKNIYKTLPSDQYPPYGTFFYKMGHCILAIAIKSKEFNVPSPWWLVSVFYKRTLDKLFAFSQDYKAHRTFWKSMGGMDVNEKRWKSIPQEEIWNFPLLQQKFLVLMECMRRKFKQENGEEDDMEDDVYYDTLDDMDAEREGCSYRFKNYVLLETGEPMYVPLTQDTEYFSIDRLKEQQDKLQALTTTYDRAQLQSKQVISDMSAFKAANPGAHFADFVRWHSPRDYFSFKDGELSSPESLSTDDDSLISPFSEPEHHASTNVIHFHPSVPEEQRGHMSKRMRDPNNLWREFWMSAPSTSIYEQDVIFDQDLEITRIMEDLRSISVDSFVDQMFPILLFCVYDHLYIHSIPFLSAMAGRFHVASILLQAMENPSNIINELYTLEISVYKVKAILSHLNVNTSFCEDVLSHASTFFRVPEMYHPPIEDAFKSTLLRFPPPSKKQFILSCLSKNGSPYSRSLPHRMVVNSTKHDCTCYTVIGYDDLYY